MSTSPSEELKEREAIKKVYPDSPTWSSRVDDMPKEQVTAIYLRFKAQGKLGK